MARLTQQVAADVRDHQIAAFGHRVGDSPDQGIGVFGILDEHQDRHE
jgi:hypothetical protein